MQKPKNSKFKPNYKKQDIRAVWIIFLLSDGQKRKQKEIKELFNKLHDEILGRETPIDEELSYCSEIFPGMDYSGHLIDPDITRLSNYLEKKGIINKKPMKEGQGAYPVFNWLKKDPFAFQNILILLKSISFDNDLFLSFGNFLINSPYGKEVINNKRIGDMLDVILGDYTEDEKQNILKMAKISPSALLNLLDLFKKFKSDLSEPIRPIRYDDLEIKGVIQERLLSEMIISVGKDLRNHAFIPPIPFKYSTTIDFDVDPEDRKRYRKCEVNGNKINLQIND